MIGLYMHVPYCTVRCSYCDFYLVRLGGRDPAPFVEALCGEIQSTEGALRGRPVDTVHFGGGTPSLLPAATLGRILAAVGESFPLMPGAEVALEANPEDVSEGMLLGWKAAGVNRVAIGVQSLDDRLLSALGRPHGAARALAAVEIAARSGLQSVGADLILGLPEQSGEEVLGSLRRLLDAGADHLSLYVLEVHDRTRLGRQRALGRLTLPDDEPVADLYEAASELLVGKGFDHYEISNFARPGRRSRHNLKYWSDEEYLGFGPSAHSYVAGARWANASDLPGYLACRGRGVRREQDTQPRGVRGLEALAAGLRLAEGVDLDRLRARYGSLLPPADDGRIGDLLEAGLVEVSGGRLRLTRRGRLLSNEVLVRLFPDSHRAPADQPGTQQPPNGAAGVGISARTRSA